MKNVAGLCIGLLLALAALSPSAADKTGAVRDIAVDARGDIVAVNRDLNEVIVFSPGSNGDVAPKRTIEGYQTDLRAPFAVAVDKTGKIYVLNGNDSKGCESVTVYAAGAHGDVSPVFEISGDKTGLCGEKADGKVAASADGTMYVSRPDADEVVAFASGADGNATPSQVLSGEVHTKLRGPTAIAVDSNGRILVADTGVRVDTDYTVTRDAMGNPQYHYYYADPVGPAVRLFPSGAGDASTIASIDGPAKAVAVVPGDDVLVVPATGATEIDIWRLSGDSFGFVGNIGGADTELANPIAVGEDASGALYVLDDRCNGAAIPAVFHAAILVYAPGSSGSVRPASVITGDRTGLDCP